MSTETHPLISIIVPVYKVEKYLDKCVKSILSQTYKNLEVILINDGSPDSCPDICDNYADQDTRVKVIHKNNSGVSDARNEGLNVANGEYIGFVDSDDWIDPKMYEILLMEILHTNADIAICDYALCKDNGLIYGKAMPPELKNRCLSKEELIYEVLQPYGGFFTVIWNKLYRKSIFDKIRFPSGKHVEDEFVLHHIVAASEKAVCKADVLYYYLQRNDSFMHQNFSLDYMDYGYALLDRYCMTKKFNYHKWKDHTVSRLSFELERWSAYCVRGEYKKKYNDLRKKSLFLFIEPAAWSGYNWHGKTIMKLSLVCPRLGRMAKHFFHKK